ncbi:hypothetical protein MBR_06652, partial [Metarhizium brunneum ARSEF 3297]
MAFNLHFQLPLVLIGVETSLSSALAAESCSFNNVELAETTGVDIGLLSANYFLTLIEHQVTTMTLIPFGGRKDIRTTIINRALYSTGQQCLCPSRSTARYRFSTLHDA